MTGRRGKHKTSEVRGEKVTLRGFCLSCGKRWEFVVEKHAFDAWQAGMHVQNAFPSMTDDDRELLISGVCGECFDKMFAEADGMEGSDEASDAFKTAPFSLSD